MIGVGVVDGLLVLLAGITGLRAWQYAGSEDSASDSADKAIESLEKLRESQ